MLADIKGMGEIQKESHFRSILKGLTWRVIASAAIFIITYMTTGEMNTAVKVTSIEFPVKLLLYYLHERGWQAIPRGSIRSMFKSKK